MRVLILYGMHLECPQFSHFNFFTYDCFGDYQMFALSLSLLHFPNLLCLIRAIALCLQNLKLKESGLSSQVFISSVSSYMLGCRSLHRKTS